MKPTRKRPGPKPKPPGEKYQVIGFSTPPECRDWLDGKEKGRSEVITGLIKEKMKEEGNGEN